MEKVDKKQSFFNRLGIKYSKTPETGMEGWDDGLRWVWPVAGGGMPTATRKVMAFLLEEIKYNFAVYQIQ